MNFKSDMAIVIPAYKSEFFEETWESIINQTDRDFHVYVGNDAGDKIIEDILYSRNSSSQITYRYFDRNLGHESLTSHWNRCFDMVRNEKWIWLFSDDDLMDARCIENFRKSQSSNPDIRLFRWNTVKFVQDTPLKVNYMPEKFSLPDFLQMKFNYAIETYAVEFIMNRALLGQAGRFPCFPLGWCSDDLFWIRLLTHSDAITIPESPVFWRFSNHNISGKLNTSITAYQKLDACCLFLAELIEMKLFEKYDGAEQSFMRWISGQYGHLKKFLSVKTRVDYLSRISNMLPSSAKSLFTDIFQSPEF